MTLRSRHILASAALVAMLGACHREEKATGHGTVSGEILPGSISDAMLPYDAVKSKAPVAPVEPSGHATRAPGEATPDHADTAAGDSGATEPDAPASPAPAAPAAAN
jgi:hypothetical protein